MIFISYSSQDRTTAALLLHFLDSLGIPHWVDSKQIDLGESLKPQILSGLSRSTAVLYLETPASRVSPWVKFELSRARAFSMPIMALKPYRLCTSTFACVANWHSGQGSDLPILPIGANRAGQDHGPEWCAAPSEGRERSERS